jgi:3-oxoacyl-[acyl-carrier protein] reductase
MTGLRSDALRGKVVLITGGGTGIGLGATLAFARSGAAVAVNYSRNEAAATRAVTDVEALGQRGLAVRADVASDREVRAMVDRVVRELGGLDILVNNAGWTKMVQPHRDLDSLADDIWDRVWAVNVKGAFYCVRAAVPHIERRGGGAIVNVTSVAAFTGQGSSMAYAASKAALATLTKSLARALAPSIRVNAVAPGLVATGFAGWGPAQFEATAKITPTGALPTTEDTAEAILYLATTPSLTGHTIVVDGGLTGLGPRS